MFQNWIFTLGVFGVIDKSGEGKQYASATGAARRAVLLPPQLCDGEVVRWGDEYIPTPYAW